MIQILKINLFTLITVALIYLATISSPFADILGIHYKPEKDFSCCKKDHLVLYHYYEVKVFWVSVLDGFTKETTQKASLNGCNIVCKE